MPPSLPDGLQSKSATFACPMVSYVCASRPNSKQVLRCRPSQTLPARFPASPGPLAGIRALAHVRCTCGAAGGAQDSEFYDLGGEEDDSEDEEDPNDPKKRIAMEEQLAAATCVGQFEQSVLWQTFIISAIMMNTLVLALEACFDRRTPAQCKFAWSAAVQLDLHEPSRIESGLRPLLATSATVGKLCLLAR